MKCSTDVPAADNTHQMWIPILEVAAQEVFGVMLNCRLTVPEARVHVETDITSMVGLAGKLCGVLSIHCALKTAEIMASQMLGTPPDKVGPELCDAFGEVANMVAGNFKNKISGLGDGCMLSVPTVITGRDYSLHSPTDSTTIEVSMLFQDMPMLITLKVDGYPRPV